MTTTNTTTCIFLQMSFTGIPCRHLLLTLPPWYPSRGAYKPQFLKTVRAGLMLFSLCYASREHWCLGSATEAILDRKEGLKCIWPKLFFLSHFFKLFYLSAFSFCLSCTTPALLKVKIDRQRVHHRCRCRCRLLICLV